MTGITTGAMLGAAGIGAIGNLIGGIFGSHNSQSAYQTQYENALKLQNSQNAWAEQMWNANNAYNDPSAQVRRLRKAGLNPNLAYGSLSGNVSQNPAHNSMGSLPQYQVPEEKVSSAAAAIQQGMLQASQVDKINNENSLMRSQSESLQYQNLATLVDTLDKSLGYRWNAETFGLRQDLMRFNVDKVKADIANSEADTALKKTNEILAWCNYSLAQEKNTAEVGYFNAQMQYLVTQAVVAKELMPYQIQGYVSAAAKNYAERDQILSVKEYQDMQNDVYKKYGMNTAFWNNRAAKWSAVGESWDAASGPYKRGSSYIDYSNKYIKYHSGMIPSLFTPIGGFGLRFGY